MLLDEVKEGVDDDGNPIKIKTFYDKDINLNPAQQKFFETSAIELQGIINQQKAGKIVDANRAWIQVDELLDIFGDMQSLATIKRFDNIDMETPAGQKEYEALRKELITDPIVEAQKNSAKKQIVETINLMKVNLSIEKSKERA